MVPGLSRRSACDTLGAMNATTTSPDRYDNSLGGARAWFADHGLTRPRHGRMLAGVTAGFARRYGVNVLVARVAAIVGVVVLTPLLYLPLWVLMPKDAVTPEAPAEARTT
jgi:phage shock protein PspC (stress-responsive transcriptional regulator)